MRTRLPMRTIGGVQNVDRFRDWQNRLVSYLHKAHRKQFAYGKNDCALFAADCVFAMTGEDFAQGYRGKYTTRAEGIKALKANGFRSHVDVAADTLDEVSPSLARAGDVAVLEGEVLGIVQGANIYVLADTGLKVVSLASAERAFRV